jgi:hypothetical protein
MKMTRSGATLLGRYGEAATATAMERVVGNVEAMTLRRAPNAFQSHRAWLSQPLIVDNSGFLDSFIHSWSSGVCPL